MNRCITKSFLLILCLLLMMIGNAGASPAQDQLKASIEAIINILQDDSLKGDASIEQRRQALREVIFERFDFGKMSQLSLARHWRDRTPQERQTFVDLFSRLLEDTYVTKIEAYTDEVIYTKEVIRDQKAQINTKVLTDDIEILINYRMYQVDSGQWLVYDLVVEGVSLVANYRSQFTRMLELDSFESLIRELEKRTETGQ